MIIQNNEEYFRNVKCLDVDASEVGAIIDQLEIELKNSARLGRPGIGLAAPQIGIEKNVAIIRINELKINLINSKIEKAYNQQIFREEGCLSFPNKVEDTLRYQEIYVTNNLEAPNSFICTGLTAVCVQHEIDHWNNKIFYDYSKPKVIVPKVKIGPNELCFCGSNIKYKKCCRDK